MKKHQIVSIIREHLREQEKILVLQGFDPTILLLLKEELLDKEILTEDGKIDLSRVNPTSTIMSIMNVQTPCMLTMESMIALTSSFSSLDILDKQFCILRNNLLRMYENPSTCDIPDFELHSKEKQRMKFTAITILTANTLE